MRGHVVDLQPGDSLLIPAFWFAHSQLMSEDTAAQTGAPSPRGGVQHHVQLHSACLGGSAALLLHLQQARHKRSSACSNVPLGGYDQDAISSSRCGSSDDDVRGSGGAGGGSSGARVLSDGALQLQLARMVEAVVAQEVGVPNVRKWLQVRFAFIGTADTLQAADKNLTASWMQIGHDRNLAFVCYSILHIAACADQHVVV